MPNPFEEAGMSPALAERIQATLSSAVQEAKLETQDEVQHIFGGSESREMSDNSWHQWTFSMIKKLGGILLVFIQRAIQLALAKFVLELCAMVIDSVMRTMTQGGNAKMDITSPNVAYAGMGHSQAAPAAAAPTSSGELFGRYTRSSDSNYNRGGSSASPW